MRTALTLLCALTIALFLAPTGFAESDGGCGCGDGAQGQGQGRGRGRGQGKRRGGQRLDGLFERFDKNEDGALTKDEVPEKVWNRISGADADGNGAVTKEELRAHAKERRGKRGRGRQRGGGGEG